MASDLTRSEVQVLRLASTDTSDTLSGNFRLSWGDGGEETDYLPFDVGEVELEAALEALQEIRDVQVRRIRALKTIPQHYFYSLLLKWQMYILYVRRFMRVRSFKLKALLRRRTYKKGHVHRLCFLHFRTLGSNSSTRLTGFPRRYRRRLRLVGFFPDRRGAVRDIQPASRVLQRRVRSRDHHGRGRVHAFIRETLLFWVLFNLFLIFLTIDSR